MAVDGGKPGAGRGPMQSILSRNFQERWPKLISIVEWRILDIQVAFRQTSLRDSLVLLIEEQPKRGLFGFRRIRVLRITGRYRHPHRIERVTVKKRGCCGDQGKDKDERAYDEVCIRQHVVHSILLFRESQSQTQCGGRFWLAAKSTYLMMCTETRKNWPLLYITERQRYQGSQ